MSADRTSARVGAIVAAAEEAAERMRADAEDRMRERIAEGDRAADNRLQAAEAEARELLAEARAEAEALRNRAAGEALQTVASAQEEADRLRATATADTSEQRERTRREAQEMLKRARSVADDVSAEGTELGANLYQLSSSLRANAERLLGDVASAHQALTAEIDRVDPQSSPAPASRRQIRPRSTEEDNGDLEIPEFLPRRS